MAQENPIDVSTTPATMGQPDSEFYKEFIQISVLFYRGHRVLPPRVLPWSFRPAVASRRRVLPRSSRPAVSVLPWSPRVGQEVKQAWHRKSVRNGLIRRDYPTSAEHPLINPSKGRLRKLKLFQHRNVYASFSIKCMCKKSLLCCFLDQKSSLRERAKVVNWVRSTRVGRRRTGTNVDTF